MLGQFWERLCFFLATRLGWVIILLLGKTLRIKFIGQEFWDRLKASGGRFIVALWHGRFLVPVFLHRRQGIVAMVSQHRDGEMIAQTLHRLGYRTVRGSSTRGGKEAFHKMVRALKKGAIGAMIPDGPRGPRHKLKPGTLYMAQQSGASILPMSFAASQKIEFKSWDRFVLPLPFSKVVVLYGEPLSVSPQLSEGEVQRLLRNLETQMIELERQADGFFSR